MAIRSSAAEWDSHRWQAGIPAASDGGHAEVGSVATGLPVDLGELFFGAGETDVESVDLAEPAFTLCLGDPGDEVVADVGQAVTLGWVGPKPHGCGDPPEGGQRWTLLQALSLPGLGASGSSESIGSYTVLRIASLRDLRLWGGA